MARLLYSFVLYVTYPLWSAWMRRRAGTRDKQPDWNERFGVYRSLPKKTKRRAWFHAVSVGEVVAAKPIIAEFRKLCPEFEIVVSCTTSTGRQVASDLRVADELIYFPVDLPHVCARAMAAVRPDLVAVLETEVWFNFLHFAKRFGAATAMVNGRISDKSFSDARRARWFYRRVFKLFDLCLMQTDTDVERARFFGADARSLGNSKYDELIGESANHDWRDLLKLPEQEPLVVVGSVRGEEEEALVLEALKQTSARIIVAPRHLERSEDIVKRASQLGMEAGRYSRQKFDKKILVLDEFGLLASTYPCADVAIIGGGFVPQGGQNIIQPMSAGCPVICGPHMNNFFEPFTEGMRTDALLVANDSTELSNLLEMLLADEPRRRSMGENGRKVVNRHKGAAAKYAQELSTLTNRPDLLQ